MRELSYEVKNKRVYPQGTLASHILGFYNPNADTAGGIEYKAKDYLEYVDKTITYEDNGSDILWTPQTTPLIITTTTPKTL